MIVNCVIPCKGRLHHLKKCIPTMLQQKDIEIQILVVDYGCPNETFKWAKQFGKVSCLRVMNNTDEFNLSRARNCGNRAVQGLIMALDADCFCQGKHVFSRMAAPVIKETARSTILVKIRGNAGQSYAVYQKKDWQEVRGYDEAMRGWGYEDTDFIMRLKTRGPMECVQCLEGLKTLPNSAKEKHQFYPKLGNTWAKNKRIAQSRKSVNPDGFGQCEWLYYDAETGEVSEGRFD